MSNNSLICNYKILKELLRRLEIQFNNSILRINKFLFDYIWNSLFVTGFEINESNASSKSEMIWCIRQRRNWIWVGVVMEENHQLLHSLVVLWILHLSFLFLGHRVQTSRRPPTPGFLRFEWTCSTYSSWKGGYIRGRTAHEKVNFQGRRSSIDVRNFISLTFLHLNYSKKLHKVKLIAMKYAILFIINWIRHF